jgi:D-glycero-alpha-D-manno-heptose-7-phosphate kinase
MIVSRAPVRISLGGGGTDLPSYFSKFGGFLVAASIDKYIFISINKRFYKSIRLSYSVTEIVDGVDEVRHAIFKEALRKLHISNSVEIVSIADVPANCGLGSSSAFTVSLLNALHAYKREFVSLKDLAEEACQIEIGILKEPIGKQDQYMASFGGICCLTFEQNGNVIVEPIEMSSDKLYELESNILIFYTGIERRSSDILTRQDEKSKQNDMATLNALHEIKKIGLESRGALEGGDLNHFGELLDVHWQAKKRLSKEVSSSFIDECYDLAMRNGSIGGKIMGAGGGGFFMFYCPREKGKLIAAMQKMNLTPMHFRFDFEGAKILVNMKRG